MAQFDVIIMFNLVLFTLIFLTLYYGIALSMLVPNFSKTKKLIWLR